METIEIYMKKDEHVRGELKSAGGIYEISKHVADQFIKEGKAVAVNFPTLKSYKNDIDKIVTAYKQEIKEVNENERLTELAKSGDRDKITKKYLARADEIEEEFYIEIDRLLREATKQAKEHNLPSGYDKDTARVAVGLIKTDVLMSSSFSGAIDVLNKELATIDRGVAIELLSQFTEIKTTLDELGGNISLPTRNSYIHGIYSKLKEKSQDERQSKAIDEVGMLNHFKKYSSIKIPISLATGNYI